MKGTSINPNAILDAVIPSFVIPADAGIQPNQASGFRVKPGMTALGFATRRTQNFAAVLMMDRVGMTISSEVAGVNHA